MARATERGDQPLLGRRVLVAEDEYFIAMELKSILEAGGAEVVGPERTVDLALDRIAAAELSAAVLDVRLGRSAIDPVAQSLADRGVPFVFYSGGLPDEGAPAVWPDAPLVSKPAAAKDLIAAVCSLL